MPYEGIRERRPSRSKERRSRILSKFSVLECVPMESIAALAALSAQGRDTLKSWSSLTRNQERAI